MLILIALMFLITVLTLLPFDKQGRQFGSTKEAGAWVMGDVHHLPEWLAPASLERKDALIGILLFQLVLPLGHWWGSIFNDNVVAAKMLLLPLLARKLCGHVQKQRKQIWKKLQRMISGFLVGEDKIQCVHPNSYTGRRPRAIYSCA